MFDPYSIKVKEEIAAMTFQEVQEAIASPRYSRWPKSVRIALKNRLAGQPQRRRCPDCGGYDCPPTRCTAGEFTVVAGDNRDREPQTEEELARLNL
ncbi:MAG: hypothetical protein FJ014_19955 [Chloroflexi bacterium]|nr:hypothetical protein [Chloroflexota bacterium]